MWCKLFATDCIYTGWTGLNFLLQEFTEFSKKGPNKLKQFGYFRDQFNNIHSSAGLGKIIKTEIL